MKRFCNYSLSLFSLLVLCGCASSERMTRLSGGVVDEYSAPSSYRLRSKKYQQVTPKITSPARSEKIQVAGLNDTLVNIWPFFFRSNAYWSVLWPFIDCDEYGLAVRPFYNQEGDDHSILFPLSSWNTAEKSGWVLTGAWGPGYAGCLPLFWTWNQKAGSFGGYYTPLVFYWGNRAKLTNRYDFREYAYKRLSKNDLSLFACLAYYSRGQEVYLGNKDDLMNCSEGSDKYLQTQWNYLYGNTRPIPKSKEELKKIQQEIIDNLPRVEKNTYGFFPLFHRQTKSNGEYSNRFLLLFGNSQTRTQYSHNYEYSADCAGLLLGEYTNTIYPRNNNHFYRHSKKSFFSLLLMSCYETRLDYVKNQKLTLVRKLHNLHNTPFAERKKEVAKLLKQLNIDQEIPPEVVDTDTLEVFVDKIRNSIELPTQKSYLYTTLPLFRFSGDEKNSDWLLPALLSWGEKTPYKETFNSVPLLTFAKTTPTRSWSTILTPAVYYRSTDKRAPEDCPVLSADEVMPPNRQCVEETSQYGACGLFYQGRMAFNVTNGKVGAHNLEQIRNALLQFPAKYSRLREENKNINSETRRNDKWQTKTEIERLRKLIVYEELKIRRQKMQRDLDELNKLTLDTVELAKKIGFPLEKSTFEYSKPARTAAAELIKKYCILKYHEDIGSDLWFQRKNFHNGDYKWHFMHILAGGSKTSDRESEHILHLFYRYRREGSRSEALYFPFISHIKDGNDSRFSFLWRLFSISKRNNQTSGYIFFIPFGKE